MADANTITLANAAVGHAAGDGAHVSIGDVDVGVGVAVDDTLIDPSFFTHDDLGGQLDAETATAIEASLAHHEHETAEAERVAAGLALDAAAASEAFADGLAVPARPHRSSAGRASASASASPSPAPQIYLAPFARPDRDESTPHPLEMTFATRPEFEQWLEGESSWCHFVQRRFTTPEKRAEERLRARVKAHERLVASLPEDQQSLVPALKRRKRKRTSKVASKITYTCHHAGKYASRHSTTLPREKLRLNTKKSVKCNCEARIVLSEMDDGECKVTYWWKHEGHDAFAREELENGRLPKVIDDWLVKQIASGKSLDEIRRLLNLPEETKAAYLQMIADDPSAVDPDMPPPLALHTRIKYPDIYNRYRKYHGRVKESRTPGLSRGRQRTQTRTRDGADGSDAGAGGATPASVASSDADMYGGKVELPADMLGDMPTDLAGAGSGDVGDDKVDLSAVGVGDNMAGVDPNLQLETDLGHFGISEHDLARLTADDAALGRLDEGNPDGLARALLRLPQGEAQGADASIDHAGADDFNQHVLSGVDGDAAWLTSRFSA
ncbi:hypothetical protein Q5752_006768 [Cryptotrichosporon argae]